MDSRSNESEWPVSALQGIDLATPGKHDVTFTINREAGRIDAEGFMKTAKAPASFASSPTQTTCPR